jgi:hypothetical protein
MLVNGARKPDTMMGSIRPLQIKITSEEVNFWQLYQSFFQQFPMKELHNRARQHQDIGFCETQGIVAPEIHPIED